MKNFLKKNWRILSFIVLILIIGGSFAIYALIYMPGKLKDKDNEIQGKLNQFEQKSDTLTAEEVNEISKSIVRLECDFGTYKTSGSGTYFHRSFFDIPSYTWVKDGKTPCIGAEIDFNPSCQKKEINYAYKGGFILTNAHVALLPKGTATNDCSVYSYDSEKNINTFIGTFSYNKLGNVLSHVSDYAILKESSTLAARNLLDQMVISKNENAAYDPFMDSCISDITGRKIYIFGYPISGESQKGRNNLIISEGIISGKDEYSRYYTSAKIDSGNSGGLAVAKINGNVCIVGIPTWVSQGKYENLGVIQNYSGGLDFIIQREIQPMVNL